MPIRWNPAEVRQAADRIEELVNQAIPILKEAEAEAMKASKINNLPQYMVQHFNRFSFEIKRVAGGVTFGQSGSGTLHSCIVTIRNTIPKTAANIAQTQRML